jgi:phenylpropionate dioxygenase-like ring-hydroxylating dioxygenase large terminal subunit
MKSTTPPRRPPPYPNSWYHVAWSDELPRGAVKTLRYFGRDLVAFRGEDGAAHVVDPYCPHLGAHLGRGRVVGNRIDCPFHGWQFGGDGRCAHIPYSSHIPQNASVHSWPVREVSGMVLIYYHAQNKDPTFEIPEIPELTSKQWTKPQFFNRHVRTHIQDINENVYDAAHLLRTHDFGSIPSIPRDMQIEENGAYAAVTKAFDKPTLGYSVRGKTTTKMFGAAVHASYADSPVAFVVVSTHTPIDEEVIDFRIAVSLRKHLGIIDAVLERFVMNAVCTEAGRDIDVWQHKIFRDRPLLCRDDSPIMRFRRWYSQFYSDEQVEQSF